MSEARKFYNACLYLTRFRYFEYIGKTDKLDYNMRKEYDLEDWFSKDVYSAQMGSYGDEFIKKVSSYVNSTLKQKELQTILRKVASDWKGILNKKAKARENNKNSKEKINIPYYKKDDFMTTEYNKQMILFRDFEKDNKIGLTGAEGRIELPKWLKKEDIQAARLKIRNGYVYLEVIYNKAEKKNKSLNKDNYCSIDPGLNIFSALTFNQVMKPVGISGLKLKSINQNYNKRVSKIDSLISNTYNNNKNLKKLSLLKNSVTEKRNLKIEHELHKISNYIVNLLIEKDIGNLIIGYNKKQKDKIKIGKRNNQNFVMIPFAKFTKILEYKCNEFGINFILQEESYTSKSSFLSNDILPIYKDEEEKIDYNFSGYRRKRGLYKDTKLKRYIQADVNGSYNIMRKNGISLEKVQDYYNSQGKTTVIDFYGITL